MDAYGSALKNKMKIHVIAVPAGHDHMHEPGVGQIGHKPEMGPDPHLDKDQDMDHDSDTDDKAPTIHHGGNEDDNDLSLNHNVGQPSDPSEQILHALSEGGAVGRSSMSLGERAKDKMKEKMASIQKKKKEPPEGGDANY